MPKVEQSSLQNAVGGDSRNETLVILFIPTKDKTGKDLKDWSVWLKAAIKVLSEQFGGATVMAPAQGAWHNPETDEVISEEVHLVHSYGNPDDKLSCFGPIASFLHRMGKATKQGEVGLVVDGVFHRITKYT